MWWFMTFYSLYDIWYHPFIIRHRTPRDSPPKGPGHVLITKPVESRGPGAIRALGISQRVFLDRFFGGKKNNPTSSKIICLLSGSFELTPKTVSSRSFLECFFDMFYWISSVWVYDIIARSYAEKITPLAWGNATETWSTLTLTEAWCVHCYRNPGREKKNAALTCQSKKFRTWNHM